MALVPLGLRDEADVLRDVQRMADEQQTRRHDGEEGKERHRRKHDSDTGDDADRRRRRSKKKKTSSKSKKSKGRPGDAESDSSSEDGDGAAPQPASALTTASSQGQSSGAATTTELFYLDRRGDAENLAYQGLYKKDFPKYRVRRGGPAIGLSSAYRFTSTADKTSIYLVLVEQLRQLQKTERYCSRAALQLIESDIPALFLPRPSGTSKTEVRTPWFVPVSDAPPIPGSEAVPVVDRAAEPDIWDFIGTTTTNASAAAAAPAPVLEDSPRQKLYKQTNADFNRKLRQAPKDVSLWLRFIDFQDTGYMSNVTRRMTASSRAALFDRKIGIYERAMKENPGNEDLLSAYMICLEERMESTALLNKWEAILKLYPQSTVLWSLFLTFRCRHFQSFRASTVIETHGQALTAVATYYSHVETGSDPVLHVGNRNHHAHLYFLLRVLVVLINSGHTEKAVSIAQAILELNWYCPAALELAPLAWKKDELSRYWASNLPHVGEKDHVPWSHWSVSPADSLVADVGLQPIEDEMLKTTGKPLDDWIHEESKRSLRDFLPSRHPDNVTDPDRIVLFDDISSVLFLVKSDTERVALILTVLAALGVPIFGFSPSLGSTHPGFSDVSLQLSDPSILLHTGSVSAASLKESTVMPPSFAYVPELLFPDPLQTSTAWTAWSAAVKRAFSTNPAKAEFARTLLAIALEKFPTNDLVAILSLAFEYALSPIDRAKQMAKQLLNIQRSNFVLWDVYACLELSQGRVNDARKVYKNALLLALRQSGANAIELVDGNASIALIARAYAMMEFARGQHDQSIAILASSACGQYFDTKPSPAHLATARERLQSWSFNSYNHTVNYALWELTTKRDLSVALSVLQDGVNSFSSVSGKLRDAEMCAIVQIVLLKRAQQDILVPPRQIASVVKRNLSTFSNNVILLHAIEEVYVNQLQPLRELLSDLAARNKSSSWQISLFAALSEWNRREPNKNRIKSLLNRAIRTDSGRLCVDIWKLHLCLEADSVERVKQLYYRGVRECPGSKALHQSSMALAVNKLSSNSSEQAALMNDFFSVMEEKELRVRTLLEEVAERPESTTASSVRFGGSISGHDDDDDADMDINADDDVNEDEVQESSEDDDDGESSNAMEH